MPVQSSKDAKYWQKQIELSIAKRKRYETWWEANLRAYAPGLSQDPDTYGTHINTNRDFTLVERKKADLFYQRPDVTLQPSPLTEIPIEGPPDPMTGQPTQIPQTLALGAHETIVNEKLGPDGIDATRMAHQALFDVECTSGTGFTKMGYEMYSTEQEVMDPMTGLPRVVPVPVAEKCYWEWFSPKQAVIPHDFRSTEWDKAPYLGHTFTLPMTAGNRQKYQLPPEFEGSKADGTQHFDHGADSSESEAVFTGTEIYYRSVLYRDDIQHPDHLTMLVLVDGIDEPVIHEDCPHQTLLPNGQLSPDSLIGFPIHPLNTRTLSDSAYVPSDCTMIRPLVNELNVYRTQQVQFRDAATMKWRYNVEALPPEVIGKIVRSPIGGMIGMPPEGMQDDAIKELPQGSMPRENFAGQQAIDDDIARTTAIDAAGAGVQSAGSQTATEAQIQQGNANARLDFERGVVLQWYCKGVTKFSTLIQRYLPVEQAAAIVGQNLAGVWDQWRKTVPATLAFTAMPDSALRVDQAVDRKASQELYSYLANDPNVNRKALLERLLRKFHIDPTKILIEPPPKTPEPPKLSISIKMEDFVLPQAPFTCGIAEQLGLKIDPSWVTISQAMQQASLELAAQAEAKDAEASGSDKHGGKVAQQESLSKHASDQTGGMQNTGAPAAMGGGGGMLQ